MRFIGKAVLVTGAAGGFGRLAAMQFAAEGAQIAIADVDLGGLAETADAIDGDVLVMEADVSSEQDHNRMVTETLDRFGGLDVALNNAGVIHPLGPIIETSVEDFDRTMAINARGVFLGIKHQAPVMIEAGGGAILNTASVAGLVGAQHFGAYVASKHAVVGLTRTAADEYARFGVRVNAVCPAFAKTPMLAGVTEALGDVMGLDETDEIYRRLSGRVPMRRVAETEEIVNVMLMLCDPANTFMTGQAIAVDGGLSAI